MPNGVKPLFVHYNTWLLPWVDKGEEEYWTTGQIQGEGQGGCSPPPPPALNALLFNTKMSYSPPLALRLRLTMKLMTKKHQKHWKLAQLPAVVLVHGSLGAWPKNFYFILAPSLANVCIRPWTSSKCVLCEHCGLPRQLNAWLYIVWYCTYIATVK